MSHPCRIGLVALLGTALVAAPAPAPAQETASDTLLTVDHYLDWEQVADPQISPDGAHVIYTRRWVNKLEDKWESALWMMNAEDRKSTRLNSSHMSISYAVFCLKKKKKKNKHNISSKMHIAI